MAAPFTRTASARSGYRPASAGSNVMPAMMTGARRARRPRRDLPWGIDRGDAMGTAGPVVIGLDNGGTSNNATGLDAAGRFLVGRMVETPSLGREGPDV